MRFSILVPVVSIVAFSFGIAACGGHHGDGHGALPPPPPMIVPEAWTGDLGIAVLTDEDPAEDVVEVSLTAAPAQVEYLPGKPSAVWAFNGGVPGPLIEAKVGDRVIVNFRNDLPEPTTIHWHGLRVDSAMDGTAQAMQPIPVGGSFRYELTVPDAGTFWYHPHMRSDVQVEKGLYGAIVVRDPAEPALAVVADELLVLDDVLIDPATGALDETVSERAMMMGREGNLALVNGRRSNLGIGARAGERRRWRIVNAANSRYFLLSLAGGEMVRVGSDEGLLPAPAPATSVLLTPGERIEVLVSVSAPGTTATLRAEAHERAMDAGATEPIDLVRLVAGPDAAVTPAPLPPVLRSIPALPPGSVTRTLRLGETRQGDEMRFTINDAAYPDVPPLSGALGTVETWEIVNETMMDHPFHLHGFRFQAEGVQEWKDTINIPGDRTVRLRVELDSRGGAAGTWLYHCHILEHAEGGMMGELIVE